MGALFDARISPKISKFPALVGGLTEISKINMVIETLTQHHLPGLKRIIAMAYVTYEHDHDRDNDVERKSPVLTLAVLLTSVAISLALYIALFRIFF